MKAKKAMIYYGGYLRRSGGAFFYARNLEAELQKLGWDVEIITLDNLPLWCRYIPPLFEKFINLFYMPMGFLVKGSLTQFLYKFFFNTEVDLRVFEDIYLSWNSKTTSIAVLHAVWSDNIQAFNISPKQMNLMKKAESGVINKISHKVITVSHPYQKYIVGEHFSSLLTKKIDVVPLGINQESLNLSPKPSRKLKSIIYTGTLEERKNLLFLLKVFKEVYTADSGFTLSLLGDGPQKEKLEEYAEKHKLPVKFFGRTPHEELIKELHKHEIYLHTSTKESFSYSLLEAKLSGLRTFAFSGLEVPEEFVDVKLSEFNIKQWSQALLNTNFEKEAFDPSEYTCENMTASTLKLAFEDNFVHP